MRGRPLRFLAMTVGGWTALRLVLLWPEGALPPVASTRDHTPVARQNPAGAVRMIADARAPAADPAPGASAHRVWAMARVAPLAVRTVTFQPVGPTPIRRRPVDPDLILLAAMSFPGSTVIALGPVAPGLASLPSAPPASRSRWSGSGWAIVRDAGTSGAVLSPLLGGSQAGARLAYRLDDGGRTAGFVRVAAPLGRGPADLAAGAQFRPGRAPVVAYAEIRRDGRGVAPAFGAFGGGTVALPADFRLEGYGQAGAIVRDRLAMVGDGQLRAVHPVGRVDAGAGLWAAAQPGARRVDIGPTVALPLSAAGRGVRVTLDWRQRIAGNARPAAGAVLSLGADF